MATKKKVVASAWDTLSAMERRAVALEALVDVRTLRRALTGDHAKVRVLGFERIRRALTARRLAHLLPEEEVRRPARRSA